MDAGSALRALLKTPCPPQQKQAAEVASAPTTTSQEGLPATASPAKSPRLSNKSQCGHSPEDGAVDVDFCLSDSDPSPQADRKQGMTRIGVADAFRATDHAPARRLHAEVLASQSTPSNPSASSHASGRALSSGAGCVSFATREPSEVVPSAPISSPVHPTAEIIGPQPFAWFRTLPRDVRNRLTSCASVREARAVLADLLGAADASCIPEAPARLAEDLRRHAQSAQWRAMDLEELLAQQASTHEAQLAALSADHKRRCRQAQLQLLAKWAPHNSAAEEARYASESRPRTLLTIGAALSQGTADCAVADASENCPQISPSLSPSGTCRASDRVFQGMPGYDRDRAAGFRNSLTEFRADDVSVRR
jgi:hypothetical protein